MSLLLQMVWENVEYLSLQVAVQFSQQQLFPAPFIKEIIFLPCIL